jgi:3D (Asp-Asp-Asp) domain-containing protein
MVAAALAALCLLTPVAQAQDVPTTALPEKSSLVPVAVVQATVVGYATGADGGNVGELTASGVRTHWGTVAADWRLYPPGTRLQLEGFPDTIFTVEDSGGAIRGQIFDVWFPDLAEARAFGTQKLQVTILAPPD